MPTTTERKSQAMETLKAILHSDKTVLVKCSSTWTDESEGLLLEWNFVVVGKESADGIPERKFRITSRAIEATEITENTVWSANTPQSNDYQPPQANAHFEKASTTTKKSTDGGRNTTEDEREHKGATTEYPYVNSNDSALIELPTKLSRFTCEAPRGKLGIVIEKATDGHAIAEVKTNSPLKELVAVGDVIVGLNGADTRSLSGVELTSLLVRNGNTGPQMLEILHRQKTTPRHSESQSTHGAAEQRSNTKSNAHASSAGKTVKFAKKSGASKTKSGATLGSSFHSKSVSQSPNEIAWIPGIVI